jgi:hypothetical protein
MIAEAYAFNNFEQSGRLKDELIFALRATPHEQIADWGKRIAKRFVTVGVKRVTNLGSLLSRLTMGTADELVSTVGAISEGRASEHFSDRAAAVSDTARRLGRGAEAAFQGLATFFQEKPDEAAVSLLSSTLGFYLGIGHGKEGFGDGGIPDLDLTFGGIGLHRSIFTHSIIAGAFVETAVISLIDLNKTVYQNLPKEHNPFWDELHKYSNAAGDSFVTGASLGIASHLGIDTTIDGFTPYKDLPISLPMGVHELLMGMNSVAEGAYGAKRLWEHRDSASTTIFGDSSQQTASGKVTMNNSLVRPDVPRLQSSIPDLKDRLDGLSEEERIEEVGKIARDAAVVIGIDPAHIDEALLNAKRKMESAKEPFRLGVIGEFRVGKSTLINALLGQEIAYTDIIEATASECRFRYGESTGACLIYTDREPESLSVEKANELLADRREDAAWLATLDHVEYSVKSECLKSFDLWDAPGIGGSDGNERLANRFIERLGGALWVIDANLVGKASIAGPLNQLKASGKPVICVINRIDEYQGDPAEIVRFVERSYPGVFVSVIPISAYSAFVAKSTGQESPELDGLWKQVLSVMGTDEAQGEEARLRGTTKVVARDVGHAVVALRRELQDRIGLVEHVRFNLRAARGKLFQTLPQVIKEETDKAFFELEAEVWKLIESSSGQSKGGAIPVDKVIALLKDDRRLSALTDTVTHASMQRLNRLWADLTDDAFSLSLAAVSLPSNALAAFQVERTAGGGNQLSRQAIEEGVYKGGVAAIFAAALAAASTAITWPVILAAIPIGALAAWKEQKKLENSSADFGTQVMSLLRSMKDQFVSTLGREIKNSIEAAIETEIERSVRNKTVEITGAPDIDEARNLENRLVLLESALDTSAVYVSRATWSGAEVLDMLENPGARLDIVLPEITFSLSPLLIALPPETEVRVIVATDMKGRPGLADAVDRAFGSWAGKRRVCSITSPSGDFPVSMPTLLITAEDALVTEASLRDLADRSIQFKPFEQGRMAAQRLFASLWKGRGVDGELLDVAPVL